MGGSKKNKQKNKKKKGNTTPQEPLKHITTQEIIHKSDTKSFVSESTCNYYLEKPLEELIESINKDIYEGDSDLSRMLRSVKQHIQYIYTLGPSYNKEPKDKIERLIMQVSDWYPVETFYALEIETMKYFKDIKHHIQLDANTPIFDSNGNSPIWIFWNTIKDTTRMIKNTFYHLFEKLGYMGYDGENLRKFSDVIFYETILQQTNLEKYLIAITNTRFYTRYNINFKVREQLKFLVSSIKRSNVRWPIIKDSISKFHFSCENSISPGAVDQYFSHNYLITKSLENYNTSLVQIVPNDNEKIYTGNFDDSNKIIFTNSQEADNLYGGNIKISTNEDTSNSRLDLESLEEKIRWFHSNHLNQRFASDSPHEQSNHVRQPIDDNLNDNYCEYFSDHSSIDHSQYEWRGSSSDNIDEEFEEDYEYMSEYEEDSEVECYEEYSEDSLEGEEYHLDFRLQPGFQKERFMQKIKEINGGNYLGNRFPHKKNVQQTIVPQYEETRTVDELVQFIEGEKPKEKPKKKKKKKKKKKTDTETKDSSLLPSNDKNNDTLIENTSEVCIKDTTDLTKTIEKSHQELEVHLSSKSPLELRIKDTNKSIESIQNKTRSEDPSSGLQVKANLDTEKSKATKGSNKKKSVEAPKKSNDMKPTKDILVENGDHKDNLEVDPSKDDFIEDLGLLSKLCTGWKPKETLSVKKNQHLESVAKWASEDFRNKFKDQSL